MGRKVIMKEQEISEVIERYIEEQELPEQLWSSVKR